MPPRTPMTPRNCSSCSPTAPTSPMPAPTWAPPPPRCARSSKLTAPTRYCATSTTASLTTLPRILLTVLDTTALCASALDRQRYSNIIDSAALHELRAAALALLHELIPAVESRTPTTADNEQWDKRYRAATTQLAAAGLHTSTDIPNGTHHYLLDRAHWDRPLRHLAHAELYSWDRPHPAPPAKET